MRENLSIFSHIWKTIKLNSLTNCQFVRYCFLLKQQLASFFVLFKRLLLLSNLILYLIINLLPLKFCLAMDSSSTCYLLSVYKRLNNIEQRINNDLPKHEQRIGQIEEKIDLIKKRLPEHSERRFLIAEIFHFLLYIKDNFSFLRCGLLFPSILI